MSDITITQRQAGDVRILDISGEITLGENRLRFYSELCRVLEEGKKKILLNLAGVRYIDPTGVALFSWLSNLVKKTGIEISIENLGYRQWSTFGIIRLGLLFKVYPDEGAALSSFS